MTAINYGNEKFILAPDESVLDVLIRHKKAPNFQCQKGVCHSCILQATKGTVPKRASENLLIKYQGKGYFLACLCYPDEDLDIRMK